ncbi:MAG: glycosyltransferase family 87 protein [Terracidiphilus sp.]
MKRSRLSGVSALLFGTALFIFLGSVFEIHAPGVAGDFKASYYSARCFVQRGCDPYAEGDVFRLYEEQEHAHLPVSDSSRSVVTRYVYLPTAFLFTAPFALLPVGPAHVLWMTVTAASLALAGFLMWSFGLNDAPLASGVLLGFLLANSGMALAIGNPAGVTVGLCVIAVWCFVNERFVPAGVICLAISLALKPHDAGFVWLYLLLAGGTLRRCALRSVAVYVVFTLPILLWTTRISPHWIQALHSNLLWFSQQGGINDPGPSSFTGHGVIRAIDLQAAISVFKDDPHFYNGMSFLACGLLFFAWTFVVLRSRQSSAGLWFVFAGIAALSMLPSYHRPYDAKLLLLTVPGFAILWAEGGVVRWAALLVTGSAICATGDFPLAMLALFARRLPLSADSFFGKLITVLLWSPTPLILLVTSIFFLWAFVRRSSRSVAISPFAGSTNTFTSGITVS